MPLARTHLQHHTELTPPKMLDVWQSWQRLGRQGNTLTWLPRTSFSRGVNRDLRGYWAELTVLPEETGEARETSYLLQRLSVAIQRGNAAAVLGCAAHPD